MILILVDILKWWGAAALIGFPIGVLVSRAVREIKSTGLHVGSGGMVTFGSGPIPKGGNPEIVVEPANGAVRP